MTKHRPHSLVCLWCGTSELTRQGDCAYCGFSGVGVSPEKFRESICREDFTVGRFSVLDVSPPKPLLTER